MTTAHGAPTPACQSHWRERLGALLARSDGPTAIFAVKSYLAAMSAYYIAASAGLERPFWAVTTCYVVSQPLAGATLSKAAFRFAGTALGATAAVALVGTLVNDPIALSLAMAVWLGFCVYRVLLDRTPRSYVFLLAGYTACIIGFQSVQTPDQVFQTALLRVQEISIGICCSTLVHSLVFPRTVTSQMLARIEATLRNAERGSRLSLLGRPNAETGRERLGFALAIAELNLLSVHLSFDVARAVPRNRSLRALQDQLSQILPLSRTVEDRIAELALLGEKPTVEVAGLLAAVSSWLGDDATHAHWIERGRGIATAIATVRDALPPATSWGDMLKLNLLTRLHELVEGHCAARELHDLAIGPRAAKATARVRRLLAETRGPTPHRDHGLAFRAALSAAATILLGCAFWIATGWADGGQAMLIAAVAFSLFSNVDDPAPAALKFLTGFVGGVLIATIYGFEIFPRVTDFAILAAVTAPPLILLGSMLARSDIAYYSLGGLVALPNLVGFNLSYNPDFMEFVNLAVAQVFGVIFAVAMLRLIGTAGTERVAARLLDAMRRDVAVRATDASMDRNRWIGRMVDRLALVTSRLSQIDEAESKHSVRSAFSYLGTGMAVGDLRARVALLPNEQAASVQLFLKQFSEQYKGKSALNEDILLSRLDNSLRCLTANGRSEARVAINCLVSLRRNMFPDVPPPAAESIP